MVKASMWPAGAELPPRSGILLDVQMPGGTGIEALKRLKSAHRTALIPVVIVSGGTDPALPDTVKALGAAAFLNKPLDPAALDAVLGDIAAG